MVHFYKEDACLIEALAGFVRQGLASGQPLLVIATAAHREALLRCLEHEGVSADAFSRQGALWMLDAHEIMSSCVVDGRPDAAKFEAAIGGLLTRAQAATGATTVRVFGEVVDLLWQEGNADAAIRLEAMWNALAARHRFTLLCAYSLNNFASEVQGFDIGDVCQLHTHVLPA